jgi:hypothetical protein
MGRREIFMKKRELKFTFDLGHEEEAFLMRYPLQGLSGRKKGFSCTSLVLQNLSRSCIATDAFAPCAQPSAGIG